MYALGVGCHIAKQRVESVHLAITRPGIKLRVQGRRDIAAHDFDTAVIELGAAIGKQFYRSFIDKFVDRDIFAYTAVIGNQVENALASLLVDNIAETIFQRAPCRQRQLLPGVKLYLCRMELYACIGN